MQRVGVYVKEYNEERLDQMQSDSSISVLGIYKTSL